MENFQNTLPRVQTKLRLLHAVPNFTNVDVYANKHLVASNLSFGKLSDYISLSPDSYEIQIFKSGNYDVPLYSESIQLVPNINYTISLSTLADNFYLFKLKDDSITTYNNQAYIRFINLSSNAPLLSLSLPNGDILFNSVEYLETTGYYQLSSGIYNFQIILGNATSVPKYVKNVDLEGKKFYTIYIIGLFNDKPQLGYLFVDDF